MRKFAVLLLIGQHFARVVKMRKISCLCILLCAGCVSVNSTVLRDRSTTPYPPNQVNVALADDEIDESCERVALLHASGNEDSRGPGDGRACPGCAVWYQCGSRF